MLYAFSDKRERRSKSNLTNMVQSLHISWEQFFCKCQKSAFCQPLLFVSLFCKLPSKKNAPQNTIESHRMLPTLSFAAFVLWLLAVPMNGPLLGMANISNAATFFLLPHVMFLFLIGIFTPLHIFQRLVPSCTLITLIASIALPLTAGAAQWLLIPLSASAAVVAIAATSRLHDTKKPVLAAASGLVLGNLLFFVLLLWQRGGALEFALVSLPLIALLFAPPPSNPRAPVFKAAELWHYLPFVLVFHIVSGLMYGVLYPAYQPVAIFPGLELPFYMLTALAAVFLVRRQQEFSLIAGILLAMISFALLQHSHPTSTNLSMFAMQAGQGFIDLFLLAYLLSFAQPVRAIGVGLATLCLGIYSGQMIGQLLHEFVSDIVMTGLIILNLAVLTLYWLGQRRHASAKKTATLTATLENASGLDQETAAPLPSVIDTSSDISPEEVLSANSQLPENLRLLLSPRECLVLTHSLEGCTYREIAHRLDISESTVKTYMKRICDKLGVQGRKGLFDALAAMKSPLSAS